MKKISLIILLLITISYTKAQDVTLLFPDNNEELTDIAVAFKATIPSDGPYVLYVCKNQSFTGEVLTHKAVENNGTSKDDKNTVYFLTYQGKLFPDQKFVLEPGLWYWRISGDGGKSYSETRVLTVNNDHPSTAPERIISPEKPIFHIRLRGQIFDYENPIQRLEKIVPDELKEYVVLDLGTSFPFIPNGRSLFEFCKLFDDAGYKFYFDLGAHILVDRGRVASLGEMEKVFRELPNCIGASTAEQNYFYPYSEADNSLMHGTLGLCKKYGKHFLLADMNWNWAKWQLYSYNFYDEFMKEGYADYFLPLYKTTDPWGAYTCVSAIQGMKLSGMVKNIGIWSDMWCWEKFGQVNTIELTDWMSGSHDPNGGVKAFPFIMNMKAYIWGITYGSTVFALEPSLWGHWQTSEPNDFYYRYMLPFYKAIINEKIIPSEKAINDNFNIIVDTEFTSEDFGDSPRLSYLEGNVWGDVLRNTYGISNISPYNDIVSTNQGDIIQAAYTEMIPNTDRYPSGIPFLVKPSVSAPIVNERELDIVKISELQQMAIVEEKLNKYYPESNNEAYAAKIDSSIFVFNTYENHDIKQSYGVGIHFAGIDSLKGQIDLMSYVMGRCRADGKSIFFQANAQIKDASLNGGKYALPNYPTILKFKCQVQPTVSSDKMDAFVRNEWDADSEVLMLEIDHTIAGAVDFTLTGDQTISYVAESVDLESSTVELKVNEEVQLKGSFTPSTLQGMGIVWKSLNPSVATVSRNGALKGIKIGQATVLASVGSEEASVSVTVKRDVGINSLKKEVVRIYPNPVKNKLFIENISGIVSYKIVNVLGQLVKAGRLNSLQNIDVSELKEGMYILVINDGLKKKEVSFIKNN